MKIHREGTGTILVTFAFSVALDLAVHFLAKLPWLTVTVTAVSLIFWGIIWWFFRVPKRKFTVNDTNILCPADGKVVVIEETQEPEYFKDKRIQLSIFMSPLDVHCNTYPVSGEISYTKYHKGKYLVAWHPKSSTENERSTAVIKTTSGTEILTRQIAGAVARRIVPYSKTGHRVEQGEELGFIKFGSRVDLFLPLGTKINVKLNDTVKSNADILAII